MTRRRVVAVWWLIAWRSGLGIAILLKLSSFILLSALLGVRASQAGLSYSGGSVTQAVYGGVVLLGTAAIMFVVTSMALRKRYKDFRILLLPRETPSGVTSTMTVPQQAPVALSWKPVLNITWLISWRSAALIATALLLFNGGIMLLAGGASGAAATVGAVLSALILLPLCLAILFLVTKMALRKTYREFRIVLVPL